MNRSCSLLPLITTILSVVSLSGCGPAELPERNYYRGRSFDNWLVSGQIANGGYDGGEVLALGIDGLRYRSRIAEDQTFAIQLPGNSTYAVYFLNQQDVADSKSLEGSINAALASTHKKSGNEALLNFEESADIGMRETLRLPKVVLKNVLQLGQIDIKGDRAFPTINPSLSLDFDYDGLSDFSDQDDQNDGLFDRDQLNENDRIEICHFNGNDPGKSIAIPLSSLLEHVEDGDSLGPCVARAVKAKAENAAADRAPNPNLDAQPQAPQPQPAHAAPSPAAQPLQPPPPPAQEAHPKKRHRDAKHDENNDVDDSEADDDAGDNDKDDEDKSDKPNRKTTKKSSPKGKRYLHVTR